MRVLFWVQHLLGTGHLKRALTLSAAMAGRGLEVVLASGGPPGPWAAPAGVELVQLPPVRAADARFSALVEPDDGRPVDHAWWARRRAVLLDLLERVRPKAVITEMFPFGRRAFRAELLPLLERAAALRPRPRVVCSVRDVLVAKADAGRFAEMRDLALAWYDAVLVHTDPRVIPFSLTFPHAADLGDRLVCTGFVVDRAPPAAAPPTGPLEVLVSVGGGAVGEALLRAALGARPRTRLARAPWRLIAGGNLPEERLAVLRRDLPPQGVALDRQRDDFSDLLARGLLSVSQAGYNTVWEVVSLGKPMVLVPFGAGSETEQRTRAGRLAALGLAEVVAEEELTPAALARAIDGAMAGAARPPRPAIDLDGAGTTARIVAALAAAAGEEEGYSA